MADETCDVELKTLPAVEGKVIKATLLTKNAFLVTKELVLPSFKHQEVVTNSSGIATLTLIRDAKLINRTVDTEDHHYNIESDQLNLKELEIIVPNTATAKLADTVQ